MSTGFLGFESYILQANQIWPQSGRRILAHSDENSVVVYQAYNRTIAESAVRCQSFLKECPQNGFRIGRMTWIKTNFLWMMYRCGWGNKDSNQERVLAIRLSRDGFDEILHRAVSASSAPYLIQSSDVRLQWDPDHYPDGTSHPTRRAIQLGLRGNTLEQFLGEWILGIEDITPFVHEQYTQNCVTRQWDKLIIPREREYIVNDANTIKNVGLDVGPMNAGPDSIV